MANTFLVVGLGAFGSRIAKSLYEAGAYVLAIDGEMERVDAIRDQVSKAVCCNAIDVNALRSVGAFDVDTAIVALRKFFDASVLVTHALHKNGIPYILTQVDNEQQADAIQIMGAKEIIFPSRDMATRIAKRLVHPDLAESIPLGNNASIIDLPCPEAFVGRTLQQLALRTQYGVTLIGLRMPSTDGRHAEEFLVNISPDLQLEARCNLLILGTHEQLARLSAVTQGQAR
ncbi:MAG: TrkA family potassium uptake protein [Magnetococcales bacterium]|nr:TrkA family potassium uptake protein [Magnetococcales bacterium]